MLVKDQMTPDPICGHPEMPAMEIQAIMSESNIRHLPILDEEKNLVGLVTQQSLLGTAESRLSQYEADYILARTKAHHIMVTDVVTIDENTAIEEAARIMSDRKIGCLPVMRAGKLVGIITDHDLFTIMVDLLGARRAGLRVTVEQPDRAGEVARLTNAIAEKGGYLSVFVTYPTADPSTWASVAKVTNVPEDVLVQTLNNLSDVRVREVRKAEDTGKR